MKFNVKQWFQWMALLGVTALIAGCSESAGTVGATPESRLNPKMSAQQKAAAILHKQRNGDLPTP